MGLSVAVIDALPEPGGQITAMYPEKLILDVAGFPAVKGRDLVANLVAQAAPFSPEYLLGTRAEKLSYADGRPVLGLAGGEQLRCGAVVVTGGLGSFTPRPLPAADSFIGAGIVYFVPHPADAGRPGRADRRRRRLGLRLGAGPAAAGPVGDPGAPAGQVPRARRAPSPGCRRCRCGSSSTPR